MFVRRASFLNNIEHLTLFLIFRFYPASIALRGFCGKNPRPFFFGIHSEIDDRGVKFSHVYNFRVEDVIIITEALPPRVFNWIDKPF